MAKHAAVVPISDAVSNALQDQSWFMRRKDTLAAVAGTVLQLVNVAAAYTTSMPDWANILIAAVVGVCQVVVHATMPGPITPSMAGRLEDAAPTVDTPELDSTPFPVYTGRTVGDVTDA